MRHASAKISFVNFITNLSLSDAIHVSCLLACTSQLHEVPGEFLFGTQSIFNVVPAAAISASFFVTLFLRRGAGGLRMRTRNLCCGLSQPSFETGLAELCIIARNQCFFAEFCARV